MSSNPSSGNDNHFFPTTHWTTVLQPIGARDGGSHAALEKLMQIYRGPIVRFVGSLVVDRQQAEDIAHDFIERLLQRGDLENADRTLGKFRSYLAKSIHHFVISRHRAENAGCREPLLKAAPIADLKNEPSHSLNGEREFNQQWWRATLEEVERRLRAEWTSAGKEELFNDLLPSLWDRRGGAPACELALKHKLEESTISGRKGRLADRYREILVSILRDTVGSQAEVEEELRFFLKDC